MKGCVFCRLLSSIFSAGASQLNRCFGLCIPEIRTAKIFRMLAGSLMLAIKVAPANYDTQTCCPNPR